MSTATFLRSHPDWAGEADDGAYDLYVVRLFMAPRRSPERV